MFAAVDVGGTKTLVAVFDKAGTIIEQVKFPTPKMYDDFKIELGNNVAKLSTKDFLRAVVAIPGRVDRARGVGVRFGNLPWENVPVQHDAEKIFRAPVLVENDAKLGGFSEALLLKDRFTKVLYLTISTGIGIGLIIDGKIDTQISDSGGRTILLEHHGKLTPWEEFASGKAIVARYQKRASEINDPKIWEAIVKDFSGGIIDLIAVMAPEVIVIGGGVGTHFDKFGPMLIERLKQYEIPMMPIPPILPAKHPEEAVIYGCYEYAKQSL
jgi:predicted NBD/HSP70 family sugar kinase